MTWQKCFCLALLLAYISQSSFAATFEPTGQKIVELPTARVFRGDVGGLQIVGADIGPENGRPLVLVGGVGTSFPYMRQLILALNLRGFRVFVYNPPGQGLGELSSAIKAHLENHGIDEMLEVFNAVRNFAFEETGKKVVVVGHSLGAMQARVGSVGVINSLNGQAVITDDSKKMTHDQTAGIVSLFSFGMYGPSAWGLFDVQRAALFRDVMPLALSCVRSMGCLMPDFFNNSAINGLLAYIKSSQLTLYPGLFGAQEINEEEFDIIGSYILPQQVSRQIARDLARWTEQKKFSTSNGLDLGKAFIDQQLSSDAIPSLYIGGEKDSVTDVAPLVAEAKALRRSTVRVLPVGHLGAFIGRHEPALIAKWTINLSKVKLCRHVAHY